MRGKKRVRKGGSARVNVGGKVRGQQHELNYGREKCKERGN